jgi:hypothetical protein
MDRVPLTRTDLDLLHSQNGFHPLLPPAELRLIVDVPERLEAQPTHPQCRMIRDNFFLPDAHFIKQARSSPMRRESLSRLSA